MKTYILKTRMSGQMFEIQYQDSFGVTRSINVTSEGFYLTEDDRFFKEILEKAKMYEQIGIIRIEKTDATSNEDITKDIPFAGKVVEESKPSEQKSQPEVKEEKKEVKVEIQQGGASRRSRKKTEASNKTDKEG